ncbi:MAG: hypothetical protein JNJ85_13765, partial [Candidatus Kapabacteria bacterium]|nr:hypothetical protein [Candidatus Kapabacteria bacterium]
MIRSIALLMLFVTMQMFAGMYGELKLSNENPQVSSEITITYLSGDFFKDSKLLLYAFVSYFNERDAYPTSVAYKLENVKKNKYETTIAKMPSDAVFAMIKVGDGKSFDW